MAAAVLPVLPANDAEAISEAEPACVSAANDAGAGLTMAVLDDDDKAPGEAAAKMDGEAFAPAAETNGAKLDATGGAGAGRGFRLAVGPPGKAGAS